MVVMRLTRQAASDAVTPLGWRFVLGSLCTQVPTAGLAGLATLASAASGSRLWIDVRGDIAVLTLSAAEGGITTVETALAAQISLLVDTQPATGPRSVQRLELAIDAMDIPLIRPFWKAALGYTQDPDGALSDPLGQGPPIWFQQMDSPRPQRNRIHFDISVPHDEAAARIEAALAAGGTLLSDAHAPAFWVLADAEGNEACITTWQGRD
jgi:4a-hydroxytetrahydrobiopterin dehydratase